MEVGFDNGEWFAEVEMRHPIDLGWSKRLVRSVSLADALHPEEALRALVEAVERDEPV
jgi:hypothetical protein